MTRMNIGIVCPYAWDIPGGVSAHVHGLSLALMRLGHTVSVLAPAEDEDNLPDFVVSTGKPRAVRYNGSVARLSFGPITARKVSRWIDEGKFDILHIHEPLAPSLSVLACWAGKGPIVATWHSSMERSRMLLSLSRLAQTAMEKITARIAVSEAARTTLVEHVGGDAIVIPNGVDTQEFADAQPMVGWPGSDQALVFLGRIDESRKGLKVLIDALPNLMSTRPKLRLLIGGPGDVGDLLEGLPAHVTSQIVFHGRVRDEDKASLLASGTIYVAPNTGGESFGIVLLEAMAAGTPVVASDLAAFKKVLNNSQAGRTFQNEDSQSLSTVLGALLDDEVELSRLKTAGLARAREFDWTTVSQQIVEVYESVYRPGVIVEPDFAGQMMGRLGALRITSEKSPVAKAQKAARKDNRRSDEGSS
ncbi:MAG: glycosyltransferase [Actinobacteria bacterium]|uniref:Unannotated protein n=1 Tax=freshwater metagenome TaxID=449393 RepID=A0A6J5YYR9_9ZZZZ|nr:glycosyltransferase [Actinomycetota bacterium]